MTETSSLLVHVEFLALGVEGEAVVQVLAAGNLALWPCTGTIEGRIALVG